MKWVRPKELARSCRPGYPSRSVSVTDVDRWIAEARLLGIGTIICLLAPNQLAFYDAVPEGLVEYYRANGFTVVHLPTEDKPGDPSPLSREELESIAEAYDRAEKPALIHCSAGIDRTGAAVTYICKAAESLQ